MPFWSQTQKRDRRIYALWVSLVILLGLASRSEVLALPNFWAKYSGDALWALMVFVGCGFLLASCPTWLVGTLALVISCTVEFSQLYHAPWIDTLRRTRLGALVLGDTFALADMAAYVVGIAFGVATEWLARSERKLSQQGHNSRV